MATAVEHESHAVERRVEEIARIIARVDGWLDPAEGRLLFQLARDADPAGAIVEIGSWHGRSTIWLAAGAKAGRGARVAAIDPHRGTALRNDEETTEPALRRNLTWAGVDDQVDVIVATSEDTAARWSRPVSLLWIDGDHEYESVKRDLLRWEEHLLPDAVVALHDTFMWPGPERVVKEFLERSRRYRNFEYADTTTVARRCERLTWRQLLRLQVDIVERRLYGVRLRAYDANTFGYARIRDVIGHVLSR